MHVYKKRERSTLELSRWINKKKKAKPYQKHSAQTQVRKLEECNIKWEKSSQNIKIKYSIKITIYWYFNENKTLHLSERLGREPNIYKENVLLHLIFKSISIRLCKVFITQQKIGKLLGA